MAELVTLVEQHMERQPPTVATQATTEWEAELALVYLQEGGLGVHQHVDVCCSYFTCGVCVWRGGGEGRCVCLGGKGGFCPFICVD